LLFEGQSDARGVGGTSSPSSSPKNMRAQTPLRPHSLPCFFFPVGGCSERRDRERIFQFDAAGEEDEEESDDDEAESEFSSLLSLWNTQTRARSHRVRVRLSVFVSLCLSRARGGIIYLSRFSLSSLGFLSLFTRPPPTTPVTTKGGSAVLFFFTSSFPSLLLLG